MILVVDAYNFIKQIFKDTIISDSFRNGIIQKFNKYARSKNHKVVLVFDGGQFTYPTKEKVGDVTIVYSGYKYTADDVIKNFISENKGSDLLLITSDRDLRNFASKLGIESITATDFNKFFKESSIQKKEKEDKILHKTTTSEFSDLDILMDEGTKSIHAKSEDLYQNINDKNKSQTISKIEKGILKKIKKL